MLSAPIGATLRQARKARGVSREALAATVGVSVRLVAEVERGARPNVSLETALQLLQALGMRMAPVPGEHDLAETERLETERRDRETRAAVRRATWVGSVSALAMDTPPPPSATVVERLAAVTQASNLVYALAQENGRKPSGPRGR
jgi:transcriptional regulator with XRE-family HTH domain